LINTVLYSLIAYIYAANAAMIPATPARPQAWTGPAALDLAVEEAVEPVDVVEPPEEAAVVAPVEAAVEAPDDAAALEAEPDPDAAAALEEALEEEPKADADPRIPPWTWLGGELLPDVPLEADS
jgi:hypothetical protein